MNTNFDERTLAAAENPDYVHYMKHLFPWWLSHLPGGDCFQPDRDPVVQATFWQAVCIRLVTEAKTLGIFIDGCPITPHRYPNVPDFAKKYSRSFQVAKLRRKWRLRCRVLGYDTEPLTQTQPVSDEIRDAFRKAVDDVYNKQKGITDVCIP